MDNADRGVWTAWFRRLTAEIKRALSDNGRLEVLSRSRLAGPAGPAIFETRRIQALMHGALYLMLVLLNNRILVFNNPLSIALAHTFGWALFCVGSGLICAGIIESVIDNQDDNL